MTVAVSQTEADRFFETFGLHSLGDVAWLKQQVWRLQAAKNKNSAEVKTRIALGVAFANLGRREEAVCEANAAFGLRRTANIASYANLCTLTMNLGFLERACCVANELLEAPQTLIELPVLSTIHNFCVKSGDGDLWKTLLEKGRSNKIFSDDDIFNLLNEHNSLDAYAAHQKITLEIIGDRLCMFDVKVVNDGSPFISQRYYIVATDAERKALDRKLFDATDAFFHKDGKPWNPLAPILGSVLNSLPIDEEEAAA